MTRMMKTNGGAMAHLLLMMLAPATSESQVTAKRATAGIRALGFSNEPPTTAQQVPPHMFTSPFDKFGGSDFTLLETDRQPRIFHQPEESKTSRDQPGFTYKDDIAWLLEGRIDDYQTFGILFDLETGIDLLSSNYLDGTINAYLGFHAAMDSSTATLLSNPKYLETDVTMDELELDMNFLFEQIHCAKTPERSVTGPDCYDLLTLVDETEKIVTNPEGEIVGATTFDGLTLTAEELEQLNAVKPTNSNQENAYAASKTNTLQGKFQAQQFSASNHYDKHSDLMKFLPDHPVKPGDEWDDHVDMVESSGFIFNGKSYLKGYFPCSSSDDSDNDNNECAIFTMEGIAHIDEEWLATTLGGGGDSTTVDTDWLKISDATVYNTFVWDIVDEIPRWTQTNVSLTLTVYDPNLIQGPDEDRMELSIPLNITMQLGTDIKQKPESMTATAAATAALGRETRSGGKLKWFMVVTFFGVVGTLFYIRKERRGGANNPQEMYNGLSNWDATVYDYESSPTDTAAGSELPSIS